MLSSYLYDNLIAKCRLLCMINEPVHPLLFFYKQWTKSLEELFQITVSQLVTDGFLVACMRKVAKFERISDLRRSDILAFIVYGKCCVLSITKATVFYSLLIHSYARFLKPVLLFPIDAIALLVSRYLLLSYR
jgi:hypothetical protein